MRQFDATIAVNREISPSWKVLAFRWPADLSAPEPGQFFTFRPGAIEPGDSGLLRRPLAFAAFDGRDAYAIYQIRGTGTKALASAAEGSALDIIGPLGNSFPAPSPGETPFLLGGGIGIGPLLFLHDRLRAAALRRGAAAEEREVSAEPRLFLGFRSAAYLPDFHDVDGAHSPACPDPLPARTGLRALAESFAAAFIATDDGSRGFAGTVVDALPAALPGAAPRHYYACGPAPMLAALDRASASQGFPAHVSVEQWMACGVGACYGCAVPARRGGYVRACADGPVFRSGDLSWEAL